MMDDPFFDLDKAFAPAGPMLPPPLPAIEPDALTRRLAQSAQVCVVGGAVRDALLGEPSGDRDWVVVGASVAQMLDLGFRPVGQDFPVFLHPVTQDEYALARTERKSAPGYGGFVVHADPSVTLQDDLLRRDLTLNAMAQTLDGRLIDPYGGWRDLSAGVLRHVSPAFTEDPLRVLRLARLAARWPQFRVAPETQALLAQLAASGELQTLVPERLWRETARALLSRQPSRYGQVLGGCGAWSVLLGAAGLPPDLAQWGEPWQTAWQALDAAPALGLNLDLDQRWTLLWLARALSVPKEAGAEVGIEALRVLDHAQGLQQRWRVPASAQDLLACAAREVALWAQPDDDRPRVTLDALNRLDVWRRPQRAQALWGVLQALAVFAAQAHRRSEPPVNLVDRIDSAWAQRLGRQARRQSAAWQRLQGLDQAGVIRAAQQQGHTGPALGQALDGARLELLQPGPAADSA